MICKKLSSGQPYFEYCFPLWGTCGKLLKDKLQRFQSRAAKVLTGASQERTIRKLIRGEGVDDVQKNICAREKQMNKKFMHANEH